MNTNQNTDQLALVDFNQAWRLKAAGFKAPCYHYYDEQQVEIFEPYDLHENDAKGEYSAPTVEQALQFLRNRKEQLCYVQQQCGNGIKTNYTGIISFPNSGGGDLKTKKFDRYADASKALVNLGLSDIEGQCDLKFEMDF
jgi:hypothetical protein